MPARKTSTTQARFAGKVTTLVPWYGSNRTNAELPGKILAGCEWVGVPFAGGMCELPHITARTILVNDLHRQVINLAKVAAHPKLGPQLYRRVRRGLFHPDKLVECQVTAKLFDSCLGDTPNLPAAEAYFVCAWMGRSGIAGTNGELKGKLALRWNAGGGDSTVRYRSAVKGLVEWREVLRRCTFSCMDCFEFLGKCKDASRHGVYVDAPWPDVGDGYKHAFTLLQQQQLGEILAKYKRTRVVVRFGDYPLIRRLYPITQWTWTVVEGRSQTNKIVQEVLLTNKV